MGPTAPVRQLNRLTLLWWEPRDCSAHCLSQVRSVVHVVEGPAAATPAQKLPTSLASPAPSFAPARVHGSPLGLDAQVGPERTPLGRIAFRMAPKVRDDLLKDVLGHALAAANASSDPHQQAPKAVDKLPERVVVTSRDPSYEQGVWRVIPGTTTEPGRPRSESVCEVGRGESSERCQLDGLLSASGLAPVAAVYVGERWSQMADAPICPWFGGSPPAGSPRPGGAAF